jgi:hypothetical protein
MDARFSMAAGVAATAAARTAVMAKVFMVKRGKVEDIVVACRGQGKSAGVNTKKLERAWKLETGSRRVARCNECVKVRIKR